MPRRPRETTGGIVYHALNRAVGGMTRFEKEEDSAAFERVLEAIYERMEMRLLGYCLMPNHFVARSEREEDASKFFRTTADLPGNALIWPAADRSIYRSICLFPQNSVRRRIP